MLSKIIESISFALYWIIWRLKNLFVLETYDNDKPEIQKVSSETLLRERPKENYVFSSGKKFVGSLKSKRKRYHNPQCRYALGLSSEDKIWFKNPGEALEAGYEACRFCHTEE
ncbi:MAG TPA: hypothetical protein VMW81_06480 [Nitrospinota bacterium]|nr:hypothetical protein [Nitrospinota bacterium]